MIYSKVYMKNILFGLGLLFIYACGSSDKPSEEAFEESQPDSVVNDNPKVSQKAISDIIQQIPSPLEISVLIKQSGTKYDNSILNSADKVSNYNSTYEKALNLGIYGTDLGYTNIYEQNQDGLDYMGVIKELADGLNIGQFFDMETIKKLATNSSNLDSLLLITTENFNKINAYLQDQKRSSQSILLLTGGWLEALHITCQVSGMNLENKELQEKIGEQKIILGNIMQLLEFSKDSNSNISDLKKEMTVLKDAFEKIKITKTYQESTYEIVDGVMVIKDNSSSTVEITDENILQIRDITNSIRSKIIN